MSEYDENGNLKIEVEEENGSTEQPSAENVTPEPALEPTRDDGADYYQQKFEESKKSNTPDNKAEEAPTEEKPKGYQPVPVEDPAIKERINYLYKQTKISDSVNKELTEMNKILVKKLEDMEKREREAEKTAKIRSLESQIVEKQRMGQYSEVTNLQRELFSLENKDDDYKPLSEQLKEEVKAAIPLEEQFLNSMTEDQHAKMVQFLNEHPYTVNESIKGAVLRRGADYWRQNPNVPLRQIAEFIDRELVTWGEMHGVQPKNKPQEQPNINNNNRASTPPSEVLTGDRASPSTGRRSVELTPVEQNAARKLFPDITAAEAYKKYAHYKVMNESER